MDGYMGEIKMFAGTYPPANWVFCQGQLLAVSEYGALYAILGVQFGGDGRSTFGVPDLRGRVPVGSGQGPGLSYRTQGIGGGYERIALSASQLPPHNHTMNCDMASTSRDESADPEGRIPAKNTSGLSYGPSFSGGHQMHADTINNAGDGDSVENMQPWMCMNFILCVNGLWPPRS